MQKNLSNIKSSANKMADLAEATPGKVETKATVDTVAVASPTADASSLQRCGAKHSPSVLYGQISERDLCIADGAETGSRHPTHQPPVNALCVEHMLTRQCTNLVVWRISLPTDTALLIQTPLRAYAG